MPAPTMLSPAEIDHFHRHGYLIVRGAFAADDARLMQREWWAEMAEVHGVLREDRSTWTPFLGDLKRPKAAATEAAFLTNRVRRVVDGLLGPGVWSPPRDWGRALVTLPSAGAWNVPTGLWHWDSHVGWHLERLRALFVVSFVGEVVARGGGTLLLAGSHRLLERWEAGLSAEAQRLGFAKRRELFHRSAPWLKALTGLSGSPSDRIGAFMDRNTNIDGVAVRVIELTGAPGDMVFCHPAIGHCVAPNCGDQPRFMRIKQQLLTHEGEAMVRGAPN